MGPRKEPENDIRQKEQGHERQDDLVVTWPGQDPEEEQKKA